MSSKILITTAVEKTWPKNGTPVVFINEGCKLFNRRHIWGDLDSETVSYHWDDRKKLEEDYKYLSKVYEDILSELSDLLNHYNNTNYSDRYWRIFVGFWLGYFIHILFDRWSMLSKVFSEYEISEVWVLCVNESLFVPNDFNDFQRLYLNDEWNEVIYHSILRLMSTKPSLRSVRNCGKYEKYNLNPIKFITKSIIYYFFKLFRKVIKIPSYSSKYFFINTYLSKKVLLFLQIRLGQFPSIWRSVSSLDIYATSERKKTLLFSKKNYPEFEVIARELVSKFIPRVYLEDYNSIQKTIYNLPWPKNPLSIITANSFSNDDIFKAWAATKMENGSKLNILQHGGYFGIGAFSFLEDHQIRISDRYISWGWNNPIYKNIHPFANIITLKKFSKSNPKGNILFVYTTVPRYSHHIISFPQSSQFLRYLEDQFDFVRSLTNHARKLLLVRQPSHDFGWNQRNRWLEEFPNIKFDHKKSFHRSIINSRLVIVTYNGTSFLETLCFNIPTLIFWDPNYWELNPEAKEYFKQLEDVGIFHTSPKSAAYKLLEIYENIEEWWSSKELQEVRIKFCLKFSNTLANPLKSLKEILI
jgi:putative transferase (TIGR04331 family)